MSPAPVRILLVEDSPSDAVLLRESLAEGGVGEFDFSCAETWAQAVERLASGAFDVLLLDLSLPDSSGRDTFVRARAHVPHLPILILTGVADEAVALDALRQGIQDYLVKGQYDGRQTARAIRYAIERVRVEHALQETQAALQASERRLRQINEELEGRVATRTAQLEETIGDLEDFSHSITHDLRAPLRAMRAFAQILGEECTNCGRPAAQEHAQRIITAAGRMDRLIQDVLQYSHVARGEMRLVPVDISALLRGIIESYPAFQSSRADIQLDGSLPRVLGNEAALTQCFSNLLDNAVKFIAPGVRPRVRIWADPLPPPPKAHPANNQVVRVNFQDNGIGIPKPAQERIFKLFHRLDQRYDGTGVGLTVVRKAVERMGGKVGLESAPGDGSRFWLDLKLANQ